MFFEHFNYCFYIRTADRSVVCVGKYYLQREKKKMDSGWIFSPSANLRLFLITHLPLTI